ncbi:UDP-N-acetylmuramoylalanine--D-glutamate ligase [Chromohalobacter marismortui]|uniref:UDP-N-acetylmuramoylalanine--D-glutamate ligase n=1 Tax=Chromohalobacter marismortui TaxID=42055 RepID=A0A4R7NPZ6_9GAMM|nr:MULTISPECIES: UDP-N-acetylmuramoyl-L-alanine--D-glutamate ligase [Chromohalobacter]MCI0508525.1 UDP-N-acetylmuramoyl-L-alanine--D-glutamate ligase [Chromohalobacter sp.]MCI0592184.1 UDP-N-acetylmuramoyl-L-alanine--D-glutamate ligase [Chromohalobacter sp.]TDU23004.1 UDP-N-acetylmuramoylalanine--D-glutamate ligase [Chromohalobacter marismortui]
MVKVPTAYTLVIGLGLSGQAIARHLARQGVPFMIADTREAPAGLEAFKAAHPDVEVVCGPLQALDMQEAREIVVSPGVDLRTPGLAEYVNAAGEGPRVVGEMALFVRACRAPIAAITGSNAKSTVTTLLGEMAQASGWRVAVGGNLGTPALDLLVEVPEAALFVLELSSFQLETTLWLGAETVAFLNLCEDHLDRHGDMHRYQAAKQRIFRGARHAVVNADDAATWPASQVADVVRFTTRSPTGEDWGIDARSGDAWLVHGDMPIMPTRRVRMPGRHNHANALAALAMGTQLGLSLEAMRRVLERFSGLPHRSELVAERDGVRWINDSKGTNVGATLAAIEGVGPVLEGRLILLAGGDGKGADFTPLVEPLRRHAREVVVFGRDAQRLERVLSEWMPVTRLTDLESAMRRAQSIATVGDAVLLSPACASLDQFPHYRARGDAFRQWLVKQGGAVC